MIRFIYVGNAWLAACVWSLLSVPPPLASKGIGVVTASGVRALGVITPPRLALLAGAVVGTKASIQGCGSHELRAYTVGG